MKTAVYGIGNILMGDDGIGPAVVHYLASNHLLSDGITLEDLGTPSLIEILDPEQFHGRRQKVLLQCKQGW